jgi:transketolase
MIPYEQTLLDIVHSDARVVILTAENRGHMRSLPQYIGDRFIDVGIAEQTMIGAAAGLALRGRIVIAHALASFLTLRPFEFIRDDIGIPGLPVILVGMVPGVLSDGNGPTHQAIDDVHLMRGIPSMNVFCPADEADMLDGLRTIITTGQPWYVRYIPTAAVVDHHDPFVPGKAEILKDAANPDVTLLTYGYLTRNVLDAAVLLESEELSVRVVSMRSLKPVDTEVILRSASDSVLISIVEDHFRTGGLASIVAETLMEAQVTANVQSISFDSRWFKPGRLSEVLNYEGLTPEAIAASVRTRIASSIRLHNV